MDIITHAKTRSDGWRTDSSVVNANDEMIKMIFVCFFLSLLVGQGATRWAEEHGISLISNQEMITSRLFL